jgi:hypothetical protein
MDITLLSAGTDEFLSGLPDDTALVLGLTWAPLTAGLQSANALSMAISARATHLVHANGKSSVGLAKMTRADLKYLSKQKITRVLSTASLLAAAKPVGTSLVTLSIGSGQVVAGNDRGEQADSGEEDEAPDGDADELVWLGAVSNGAVLRGHDLVVSRAHADEIWVALQERYGDKVSRFDEEDGFGWHDLLEVATNRQEGSVSDQSILRPAKAGSMGVFRRFPKPVKFAGFFLGIAALAQYFVIPIVHYEIAKYKKAHSPKIDALALWQDAYRQWTTEHKLAGSAAGKELMTAIGAVPVTIANWSLTSAKCDMESAHGKWKCAVLYTWPANGIGLNSSTNSAFEASVPKAWLLDWSPMGSVTGRFFVKADTDKFEPKLLHSVDWHLIHSVSFLQHYNRVLDLSTKPLTSFARVPIPAPKLSDGKVVPAPSSMKFPVVATVKVQGPLRTIEQKVFDMQDVSWEKFEVSVDDHTQPNRNKSELKASLQGEIYAKP